MKTALMSYIVGIAAILGGMVAEDMKTCRQGPGVQVSTPCLDFDLDGDFDVDQDDFGKLQLGEGPTRDATWAHAERAYLEERQKLEEAVARLNSAFRRWAYQAQEIRPDASFDTDHDVVIHTQDGKTLRLNLRTKGGVPYREIVRIVETMNQVRGTMEASGSVPARPMGLFGGGSYEEVTAPIPPSKEP